MPLLLLSDNPLFFFIWVIAILVALSIHEFAHAYASYRLGDNTAQSLGRLTLNPMAHVDWLGFFMLVLVGFGWGRPVPFNPHNLKYKKWGPAIVSLAGPFANFIGIVICGSALKLLYIYTSLPASNMLIQFLGLALLINAILLAFNLIPIPPLDGSKLLFAILENRKYDELKEKLERQGPFLLLGFIIMDRFLGLGILSHLLGFFVDLSYRVFS